MDSKNGVVETRYDNGQLSTRENYKDDKREGLCETWYENGKLLESTTYKDGVKQQN